MNISATEEESNALKDLAFAALKLPFNLLNL